MDVYACTDTQHTPTISIHSWAFKRTSMYHKQVVVNNQSLTHFHYKLFLGPFKWSFRSKERASVFPSEGIHSYRVGLRRWDTTTDITKVWQRRTGQESAEDHPECPTGQQTRGGRSPRMVRTWSNDLQTKDSGPIYCSLGVSPSAVTFSSPHDLTEATVSIIKSDNLIKTWGCKRHSELCSGLCGPMVKIYPGGSHKRS